MAKKITITYTKPAAQIVSPAAPICSVMLPTNAACDMKPFEGTYYDTNVEGWGEGTTLEQFMASVVAHPGLVAAFRKAQADGSYVIEAASDEDALYLGEVQKAVADQGIKIKIEAVGA